MYPCYREGIVTDGRESFPAGGIAAENLLYLANWTIAGWLLWPVRLFGWPVATLGWIALVVAIQVALKKHNCSGCYYYDKACHLGWGKLAALLFKQDSGDIKIGMRLSLFYILSPPLMLVSATLIGLLLSVTWVYWVGLGVYVALNAASFPLRIKGCRVCAMRKVCPGSAVKGATPS